MIQSSDNLDLALDDMSLDELVGRLYAFILIKEKVEAAAVCCGLLGCFIPVFYLMCIFFDLLDVVKLHASGVFLIGSLVVALLALSVFSFLFSIYLRDQIKKVEYYIKAPCRNNH